MRWRLSLGTAVKRVPTAPSGVGGGLPIAGATAGCLPVEAATQRIRRLGALTRRTRLVLTFAPLGVALAFVGWVVLRVRWSEVPVDAEPFLLRTFGLGLAFYGPPLVLLGWMAALPTAAAQRLLSRFLLRRQLRAMPARLAAESLAALRREPLGDTRKIVAPLLREFGRSLELAPAAAPDAHGDEPSPAEEG
jgi:hypothetical protein